MEGENIVPSKNRLDSFIVKYFPLIVIYCLVLVTFFIINIPVTEVHELIYAICLGFSYGFVTFGFVCIPFIRKQVVKFRYSLPILIILPLVFSLVLFGLGGPEFTPNMFVSEFYLHIKPGEVTFWTILFGSYLIEIAIISVAAAVSSIISAYFRKYFSKILIGPMKNNPNQKVHKASLWLFKVPDMIDVDDVVLEPEGDDGKFNIRVFREIVYGIFITGLAICSFMFLNPYFVKEMPLEIMLMTSILLSLFIAALVIPWHIIRTIGVKVKSSAPRDYYLWKGMQSRLTSSAAVVMFFVLLFYTLAYLEMDLAKVLIIYASYMIFMLVISVIYSFVYVNSFYHRFKDGMIYSFYLEKDKMLKKLEDAEKDIK
ncbi:MAG TPA: hypothetical protein VJX93_05475 [Candidatus Methanomethylophilaceae archaeon]|nr:hypothetical protein [Candidatus Methanomethylophilaceae archaeon]